MAIGRGLTLVSVLICCGSLLAQPTTSTTTRIEIANFDNCARDRFVDAQTSTGIKLAPTLLLTNENGVRGNISETLSSTHHARVTFDLSSAAVASAELLFYVNGNSTTGNKPMRLLVNDQPLSHRQDRSRMLTGGWDRTTIPAAYLVQGENEFIFADNGVLYVDPGPDQHSSRSFDGGQTWHQGTLGPNNDLQGNYMVRLRLKGHPPAGQLTSPIIDLADPDHKGRIASRLHIDAVRLSVQKKQPSGTEIQFEMRSGSTPSFDPERWTPWQHRTTVHPSGRYLQWRATLRSQSAATTPVLENIVLEADIREDPAALAKIHLVELDQPAIVRSSYEFTYMPAHSRLTQLRQENRLEEVVAPGQTELEKFALLRHWIHSQWIGWQGDKYPYCPTWDPLEILDVTRNDRGYGMCTHYSAVFAGCAAALGYASRVLIVDHHCLAEVWSEDLQKWILQDTGPNRDFNATYERDGVPLNALEMHQAFIEDKVAGIQFNKRPQQTLEPVSNGWARLFVRFGIPLRNDHLIAAAPAELHHGENEYHWNGYLWWSDDSDPQYSEYSLQTSRPEDFYWSVNHTRLYLQTADQPQTLQLDLETATPNFSHYLVRIDQGGWKKRTAPLQWQLQPGSNELAVRSVNVFGKEGRIARARVLLKDETL
jgi:transglutaminase-like putative cysteine protease